MTTTAHYKRLVLELCHACRRGDVRAIEGMLTPDFLDTGEPALPHAFADEDLEILGLVGEGSTVALRVRRSELEQVQFFEGRDARLASRVCVGPAVTEQWVRHRENRAATPLEVVHALGPTPAPRVSNPSASSVCPTVAWMKAESIRQARERHPELDGLLTDTADSNHHMRSINDALGYIPTHKTYEYQLDL